MIEMSKRSGDFTDKELACFDKADRRATRSSNFKWVTALIVIAGLVGYKIYKKYEKPTEPHEEKPATPKKKEKKEKNGGK